MNPPPNHPSQAPHYKRPRAIHGQHKPFLLGRPFADDSYARDYARLDRLSRTRALTLEESLRLEECIRRLDRRAGWRESNRKRLGLTSNGAER